MKTIQLTVLFLTLYGGQLVKAGVDLYSERWLPALNDLNKRFPDNDELKLATILTKRENWSIFNRAFNETGFNENLENLLDKLKEINQTLYEEIKAPYDRLAKVFKTLNADERAPAFALFEPFRVGLLMLFRHPNLFWRSSAELFWERSYDALTIEQREKIRPKFPFSVALSKYLGKEEFDSKDETRLTEIIDKMLQSGAWHRVMKRAEHNFDFRKIMDAIKAEDQELYAEVQPIAERLHKAYEDLPPKPKALVFKYFELIFNSRNSVPRPSFDDLQAKTQELLKLCRDLSKEDRSALRKSLPNVFKAIRFTFELIEMQMQSIN